MVIRISHLAKNILRSEMIYTGLDQNIIDNVLYGFPAVKG
jgi:hypothetical protein